MLESDAAGVPLTARLMCRIQPNRCAAYQAVGVPHTFTVKSVLHNGCIQGFQPLNRTTNLVIPQRSPKDKTTPTFCPSNRPPEALTLIEN